jgi:type IV pilus assembly protein PilQ
MKIITTYCLLLLFVISVSAQQKLLRQQLQGYVNPEEIVTLSETISFDQAVAVLSDVSLKASGKTITSTFSSTEPIGLQIDKMPYTKALNILVNYLDLIFEEFEDVIVIKRPTEDKSTLDATKYAPVDEREVKISALFFEANISDMNERGINWQWMLEKAGLSFGTKLRTFTTAEELAEMAQSGTSEQGVTLSEIPPDFTVDNSTDFNVGDFTGTVTAAFKWFESNNLGELLARPSISVRNGNQGKIQIGSDISIKQRDFSGNLVDNFYATGIIVDVTPYIYTENGIDYVLLKLVTERSSVLSSTIERTEIQKTNAATEILMLDGEETIIGGLFATESQTSRNGIPILKDLPWWVLGIRFLTGYDLETQVKKEVIITIKVDILPSLEERIAQEKQNIIKRALQDNDKYFEQYKIKNMFPDSRNND